LSDITDPLTATVLGHAMVLHPPQRDRFITPALLHAGVFEPLLTELMPMLVRPSDVVLDVGAHVGYFTLQLARLVGPTGHVHAFEPDPDSFALLRHNVQLNGYANVTCNNLAVSDRCQATRLYRNPDNAGDHQLYCSDASRESIEVEAVSLDHHFAAHPGGIAFIKMDIQGFEQAALAGMRALLARCPRLTMLTEFWPYGLDWAGGSAAGFLRLLQDDGFRLWDAREGPCAVQRADPSMLGRAYPKHPYRFTNLLAVKSPDPGTITPPRS
jgi:FkbM family methyltransferase